MPDFFWPTILLVIALGVICLEIFIPSGGVLSVIAGLTMLASIFVAFIRGGIVLGTVFMALTAGVIPLVLFLLVRWWPRTAIGQRILIKPPPAEELVPDELQSLRDLIGQRGKAVTPMLPSGAIRLERRTIDAVSEGMSIEAGTLVQVIAAKGNHLVVRPVPNTEETTPNIPTERPLDAIVPDPFDEPLP